MESRINLQIQKKDTTGVPEAIRSKGKALLVKRLSEHLTAEQLDLLEQECNNSTIKSLRKQGLGDINMNDLRVQRTYNHIIIKCCQHLDPKSPQQNTYLLQAVKDGRVRIIDIPSMSPIMLDPIAWEKQYNAQMVEARQVAEGTKKARARILTCNRCLASNRDAKNVEYEEKQDRSADEAATIHAQCNTCGFKWTQ